MLRGTTEGSRLIFPRQATWSEAVEAASPVNDAELEDLRSGSVASWCRTWGFHVEVLVSTLAGLAVIAAGAHFRIALAVLAVWAVANFHKARTVTSPLPVQLKMVAQAALVPLALTVAAFGFSAVPAEAVRTATVSVVCAAAVSGVFRALRWRLQSPVRVLLVGDRVAIAQAASRWDGSGRVRTVAAVLVEPDLQAHEIPQEIMDVPVVCGLEAAPAMVDRWRADLAIVAPGPSFTSIDLRRLAWRLEETRASLGVLGILDSVAPHRITPGSMQGATVTDVRLPRPSSLVQAVKMLADRIAAVVLLVLVSPLLLLMTLAIRIDSRGKAFFTQTRVGLHGRHFIVYKMRTMVAGAEEIKVDVAADNEYDGVLFKIRSDPRITRVGALLRRSSLDELPQLINVVRGEMSLVGPRPSLPSEVEIMDSDTQRRLAVRPGITGLWQISGRSDLPWKEAAALDTYYADNWSLSGDVGVLLRTVKAVVSAKGAY